MKHGVAFRKFSRTSSHRMLMMRNLVTSLFEHEQIKTTLPKARDTARLAEKIITLGKKGSVTAHQRASAFLLKPTVISKVFGTFAERYAERPGGYTRIHKFGHRPGDNAPHAILELVDNPKDLRLEMTSRAIGWELLKESLKTQKPTSLINRGVDVTEDLLEKERNLHQQDRGRLRSITRWNLQKILRFRHPSATAELGQKVGEYIDSLLAKPIAFKSLQESLKQTSSSNHDKRMHAPPRRRAGEGSLQEIRGALSLAKGVLGSSRIR